ncbi:hypothetical protein [Campylobacter concisus]|uniref:hypothetical protein n=1 Tax=Campylobacter concisus TaxID=199 RepID=UPI000CD9C922|nr:hypothetical protein [Campylobacter concisus]
MKKIALALSVCFAAIQAGDIDPEVLALCKADKQEAHCPDKYGKVKGQKPKQGIQKVFSKDDSNLTVVLTYFGGKPNVIDFEQANDGKIGEHSWSLLEGNKKIKCKQADIGYFECEDEYTRHANEYTIWQLSDKKIGVKVRENNGKKYGIVLDEIFSAPIYGVALWQHRTPSYYEYLRDLKKPDYKEDEKYRKDGGNFICSELKTQYPKVQDFKKYVKLAGEYFKREDGDYCSSWGDSNARDIYYVYKDMVVISYADFYKGCGNAWAYHEYETYIGGKLFTAKDFLADEQGLIALLKKLAIDDPKNYENAKYAEKIDPDEKNIWIANDKLMIQYLAVDGALVSHSEYGLYFTFDYDVVEPYLTEKIKPYFKRTKDLIELK